MKFLRVFYLILFKLLSYIDDDDDNYKFENVSPLLEDIVLVVSLMDIL